MKCKISACFLVACFLFGPVRCIGKDNYVAFGEGVIAGMRAEMHTSMTDRDRSLDESIAYYTVESPEVNAFAAIKHGHREITVYTGLIEAIDYLATVEAVSLLWNRPSCSGEYTTYLADLATSNFKAIKQGLRARNIIDPFQYMKSKPASCPDVSQGDMIANKRKSGDMRTIQIQEGIKFVLLHEFAHHLHNDFSPTSDLIEKRARESRADNYAFQSMLHPPETPTAAISVIALFAAQEDLRLDIAGSNHPSGLRRLKAMIDATRTSESWKHALTLATPDQKQIIENTFAAIDRLTYE
jgi:hypothetical protein